MSIPLENGRKPMMVFIPDQKFLNSCFLVIVVSRGFTLGIFLFFLVAIFFHCFDDFVRQINRLTTNVLHYIETSQLTCNANQLTGFYMMENIGR